MAGHIYVAPGDITQLSVDAIAFSASSGLARDGNLCSSFENNIPAFSDWFRALPRQHHPPVPVGSTFWLTLDPVKKPHGIVVVVSTGSTDEPDKAGIAVRGSMTRAYIELRKIKPTGRLLIGLPAFRVGRGGDHYQRMESAIAQIQSAKETLKALDEVDVAFLTYTPALYRIFLEARLKILGPPTDVPRFPELERALRDQACVLFVGAGSSRDSGLPGWDELIARLALDLQIKDTSRIDHLDLAQWYREQFGNDRLAEVLRTTFAVPGLPSLAHYLLMGLPLRHVITTNYDSVLEQALIALKRHPVPVVRQEEVAHTGGAAVYVVKLHGDARQPQDIVLSRDDYAAFFERRPAMALLLEGLLLNQTFFFVGYSLRDPNFRQLFSRIARMLAESRRPAFATSFEAQGDAAAYLEKQWRRQQLHLIPITGTGEEEQKRNLLRFLDALSERVTLQAPPLALAADLPGSPTLGRLRDLLHQVGAEVEQLCNSDLPETDVHFLARVVDFLNEAGWRPRLSWTGTQLSRLYERLADRAADADLRRRLLVLALGNAEMFTEVARLRERITKPVP